MKQLDQKVLKDIHGGDALAIAGWVGIGCLIVGLEYYVLLTENNAENEIDFNSLTSEEAYHLGLLHGEFYCRHFYF